MFKTHQFLIQVFMWRKELMHSCQKKTISFPCQCLIETSLETSLESLLRFSREVSRDFSGDSPEILKRSLNETSPRLLLKFFRESLLDFTLLFQEQFKLYEDLCLELILRENLIKAVYPIFQSFIFKINFLLFININY